VHFVVHNGTAAFLGYTAMKKIKEGIFDGQIDSKLKAS
jgi:hypothetical protein